MRRNDEHDEYLTSVIDHDGPDTLAYIGEVLVPRPLASARRDGAVVVRVMKPFVKAGGCIKDGVVAFAKRVENVFKTEQEDPVVSEHGRVRVVVL
jgi:hypothetical protein